MSASAIVRAIAGHGLAEPTDRFGPGPLDEQTWQVVRTRVRSERLEPLLSAAVAECSFSVTDDQRAEVERDQEEAMKAAVDLDRLLIATAARLSAEGIPTRALKGASAAYLAYPTPSMRAYGDVDLLVPAAELGRAVAVLERDGGTRRYAEPRPGFDREFSKGACVVLAQKREVDLHRTLAAGPFGQMIDLVELFGASQELQLGGTTVEVMSAECRLVHAAYHAVLGATPPRLVALRDVAQLVFEGDDVVDKALSLARAWGGEAVMAMALREAWRSLGPDDRPRAVHWAQTYEPSRADERRLRAYMGPTRSTARQSFEAFLVIPGLGARWRYARAVALPTTSLRSRSARWRGVLGR